MKVFYIIYIYISTYLPWGISTRSQPPIPSLSQASLERPWVEIRRWWSQDDWSLRTFAESNSRLDWTLALKKNLSIPGRITVKLKENKIFCSHPTSTHVPSISMIFLWTMIAGRWAWCDCMVAFISHVASLHCFRPKMAAVSAHDANQRRVGILSTRWFLIRKKQKFSASACICHFSEPLLSCAISF